MPRRVLIVGPSWVGDIVMTQSLCISLRQREPDVVIDVLAPGWGLPLVARMPEVRRGIEFPVGHGEVGLGKLWRLGRSLAGQYDQAIILPRKLKAALPPFFAGIRQRTGFTGESRYWVINDRRPFDPKILPLNVQRHVTLGLPPGTPLPPPVPQPRFTVDLAHQAECLKRQGLDLSRPAIAMAPGAEYGPAKQWPLDNYGVLAAELVRRGYQVWIFGSKKEIPFAEHIIAKAAVPQVVSLCGKTSLVEVVDLLAACKALVSNDSGLMHVAAAAGIPVVPIYGSSSPYNTPPLTDKAKPIYLALSCSPCYQRTCPLGHLRCLNDIHPPQVLEAMSELGIA